MVTLLARGAELHADVIGSKSIGGDPVQRDTLFRLASITKPITAVAALILVEECKLRLDEPLDGLLPEPAGMRVVRDVAGPVKDTVPAQRSITLRDLLTFRMGTGMMMAGPGELPIVDRIRQTFLAPRPPKPSGLPDPDTYMRGLGELPLIYQPGERWLYNTGAEVLGVLVARASGQTFDRFLSERIFEPLGMVDTGFVVPDDKLDRLATLYLTNPETGGLIPFDGVNDSEWRARPAFPNGAAGLVSTADDYLAFASMLLNGGVHGGRRILSRPSVEVMTANQLTPEQGALTGDPDFGFGFGVSVVRRRTGLASIGRYGWDGGFGTSWFNDPREGITAILLTQASWTSPAPPKFCLDFWTRTYAALDD
jgi:CubicO group peptidase (beta-lactamase class C family)